MNAWWKSQLTEKTQPVLLYIRHSETAFLLFFSIAVGIFSGFGAIFFRWLINSFRSLFFESGGDILSFLGAYYVILVPATGGLIVGPLVYFLAREAKGHGVPEVMLAVSSAGG